MVIAHARFLYLSQQSPGVLVRTMDGQLSGTRALVLVRSGMQTEGTEAERPATTETSRRASGDIRHEQPARGPRWARDRCKRSRRTGASAARFRGVNVGHAIGVTDLIIPDLAGTV